MADKNQFCQTCATEAMKDFSRIDVEIRRLDSRIGSVEGKGR